MLHLTQPPREQLGVPLYETLGPQIKRDLEVEKQKWGEDKWPAQRIIEIY
jgi:hypothetical protein